MGWSPKCITHPVTTGVFIFIVAVIWFELAIGLVATSYTAFLIEGKTVELLPCLIFAVYVCFASATLYFTVRSTWGRFNGALHNIAVNWLTLGLTTVETIVILVIIFGYNHILTENQHQGMEVGWLAVGLFVMTFFGIKMGLLMYLIQRREDKPLPATEPEKEEILP